MFHTPSGRNTLYQNELRDGFLSVSQAMKAESVRERRGSTGASYIFFRISNTQIHCG
jgi:hypothetical protein